MRRQSEGYQPSAFSVWILTDDVLEDVPPREQFPDLPFIIEAPK